MVPLGQLENALIVAQTADGTLCLIDQHRAHERLLYNALVRDFPPNATPVALAAAQLNPEASDILDRANDSHARADEPRHTTIQGQLLLEPLMIELSPRQAELLSSRLRELGELGLICEPFGGATFLIRALPTMPGAATGLTSAARAVAADAAEDADDWLDHFRIALACRAAIRRGQALATSEQRALLDDLILATAPAVCPHGSPIMLEYSQSFLARTFEWGG
jgi:DNA mismatch repair protein MutL